MNHNVNAKTAKDYLPLLQALAEGKTIQMHRHGFGWVDLFPSASHFMYDASEYRIKPEPREIWVNRHMNGDLSTLWHESKEAALFGIRPGWDAICYREVVE